jgi:hypothetical protein
MSYKSSSLPILSFGQIDFRKFQLNFPSLFGDKYLKGKNNSFFFEINVLLCG